MDAAAALMDALDAQRRLDIRRQQLNDALSWGLKRVYADPRRLRITPGQRRAIVNGTGYGPRVLP